MAKEKTVFFCSQCGHEAAKWMGRCPGCGQWNTMVEERVRASAGKGKALSSLVMPDNRPVPLSEIEVSDEPRILMPSSEFNRVLGGGLVVGSLTLIGGEPGVGKSTLILQNLLSVRSRRILYVSGEESATQLKLRAERLGKVADNTLILCETSLERIFSHIEKEKPGLIVIDSIQTMASEALESAAGSVSQVRECAAALLRYAKSSGVPVLLVGHINKEGSLAGPKVLEHIVDTVLQFEGDRQGLFRILRAMKNRFGSTSEIGVYEMIHSGLREVKNPAEMLLPPPGGEPLSGVAIGVSVEGARPFLIETQALVSTAAYGTPQRSVTGFDQRRLNMLLAVLEKRVGFKLAAKDVFLNIAGGLKVSDPALDLAIVVAVLSSNFDIIIPSDVALAGEVGLSGEIRPVTRAEMRVAEAEKLGFSRIFIPAGNLKASARTPSIEVIEVRTVEEVFRNLLGGE